MTEEKKEETYPSAFERAEDKTLINADFYSIDDFGKVNERINPLLDSNNLENKEPLLTTIIIICGVILLIFMLGI